MGWIYSAPNHGYSGDDTVVPMQIMQWDFAHNGHSAAKHYHGAKECWKSRSCTFCSECHVMVYLVFNNKQQTLLLSLGVWIPMKEHCVWHRIYMVFLSENVCSNFLVVANMICFYYENWCFLFRCDIQVSPVTVSFTIVSPFQ